jgi:hypothetical protein
MPDLGPITVKTKAKSVSGTSNGGMVFGTRMRFEMRASVLGHVNLLREINAIFLIPGYNAKRHSPVIPYIKANNRDVSIAFTQIKKPAL